MSIEWNEISSTSNGGTELLGRHLESVIDPDLLKEFQIFPSRVRGEYDPNRIRILWLHDLPGDPESSKVLENGGWNNFHRIVAVSHWQSQAYMSAYNIPWSKMVVLQNAIVPIDIDFTTRPTDEINIVYTSTPHRGLNILLPVFDKLQEKHPNIRLHLYSSFKLYGWNDRDQEFESLFQFADTHPKIFNHGAVPNDQLREELKKMHILAYPSVWPETSCLCLMEAMSAGLACVHPSYGALPETAANWTFMYPMHEDQNAHAGIFYSMLDGVVEQYKTDDMMTRLYGQKSYTDIFYNWAMRKVQWESLLNSLLNEPRGMPKPMFSYRA